MNCTIVTYIRKCLCCLALTLICAISLSAQQAFKIRGSVSGPDGEAVEFASVVIPTTGQWAVADAEGKFVIEGVKPGKIRIEISSIGYVADAKEINISKDVENFRVTLKADNLALDGAVVTAKENSQSATTSRSIDRAALDHVQLMNVADISSLLPGGTTTNPSLLADQQFNLRAGSGEMGNSSFTTAVEIDGMRLSNNASFGGVSGSSSTSLKGSSTSNIASSNIESVEVITGVPSVEYGDMTSGVVKISTRQGKTPLNITMSTSPSTKQLSAGKGFGLGTDRKGRSRGVVNANVEYAKSVAELMSPYRSYDRKQLNLSWNNAFTSGFFSGMPLKLTTSLTGNLGGLDTSADPDSSSEEWTLGKDNALRASTSFDWLLSKPWITNLEMKAAISYSDKTTFEKKYYSASTIRVSLHSTEQGYYMTAPYDPEGQNNAVLIPSGYWTNILVQEDRPLTSKVSLKAILAHNSSVINSKLKLGGDWTSDSNRGRGLYSEDLSTAETFRPWQYCNIPTMHNMAAYLEEDLTFHFGGSSLNIIAGLRNDNTLIKGSAYGITSSVSPRFNARYNILQERGRRNSFIRSLSLRGSWGMAVKQPSYAVLYPQPSYRDVLTFTSTSNSSNVYYQSYVTYPRTIEYNPSLKWQQSRQGEFGIDVNLAGNKISLAGFYSRTLNSYRVVNDYESISYNYTSTTPVYSCGIPSDDRVFTINHTTGEVTVSDRTGANPSVVLESTRKDELSPRTFASNQEAPLTRYGLEWVLEFKRIEALNTTIRIDGTWYTYRGLVTDMHANSPYTQMGSDRLPFRYVGWYYGGNSLSNGSESSTVRNNLTVTTHIPAIRLIISAKLESTLMNYSRSLSHRADGSARSLSLSSNKDIFSYDLDKSIYDGDNYNVYFPDYYTTWEDPSTKRDYLADLLDAKAKMEQLKAEGLSVSDEYKRYSNLFNDLTKLALVNSYAYTFKKDWISPYFSANFSVTKEIGDVASISFYANNFFNSCPQLYSTKTETYIDSARFIPKFFYGLTLRFKFK